MTLSDQQLDAQIPKQAVSVRPLQRRSLAEQVADELRNLILLEELLPGAPIPERETADALGVSRTPLRESLRLLATEGLVEIAPNRPPRVAAPTIVELQQLFQVQSSLESLAGELACQAASEEQLNVIFELEKNMRKISDSSEPLTFFQNDMEFHSAIVHASGNEALVDTHATYNARLWRARFISSRRRVNREGTLDQHTAIASALLARDHKAAATALRLHLDTGFINITKALSEKEPRQQSPIGSQ